MPYITDKKVEAIPARIADLIRGELKPSSYVDAEQIRQAGQAILHCRDSYSASVAKKFTERSLNLALFAYLHSRYPSTTREHQIQIGKTTRRVDFRIGGPNPALVEFAYRRPGQARQPLQGEANAKELQKLGRFPESVAKRRILLLVYGARTAIPKDQLQESYANVSRGQGGKNVKHTVTVVYVHTDVDYRFTW